MESLARRAYLVTGGSSGLGLAAARSLTERGARVAVAARDRERLATAVETLGEGAFPVCMDVTDKASVDSGLALAAQHFGGLDGIVTCAGLTFAYPIETLPEERLRHIVDVSLIGTVFCCQAAIPLLRERRGRIVTVSSASARHREEFPHMGIYAAVKAAVERLTAELRDEVKRDGIGVTCISPGAFESEIAGNFDPDEMVAAYQIWVRDRGPDSDGVGDPRYFGEAVAHALSYPPGMAIDFMEVRPNVPTPKV